MQYGARLPTTATLFWLLTWRRIVILSVIFRVIEGVVNSAVIVCCDWQSRNERDIALDWVGGNVFEIFKNVILLDAITGMK